MSKRYYKPQTSQEVLSTGITPLPTDRPIAVYYRQSTDAQIGNVSTSIQTIDMVAYLKQQGWSEENIYLIDMDAGVSGTTKIDERPGMSLLFDLITQGRIAVVACQDEDRLFRDVTQIQVNIFIEACRTSKVLLLTPSMIYDFSNELTGTFHARQFRFKSEMAAEYISTVIKGKLHRAKRRLLMEGRWAGNVVLPGFMVDVRKTLVDGSKNPNWRRYVEFPQYAEVVREYFRLFLSYAGNVHATVKHIHKHGPYYPNPAICPPPEGFRFVTQMKHYGHGYCPARNGLVNLLTNVLLLGHWTVNDVIVRWNNHQPIINEEIFWRAFNYLSSVTLDGQLNPHYRPFSENARPTLEQGRSKDRPVCAGMLVSYHDSEWRNVGTTWLKNRQDYIYVLAAHHAKEEIIWRRNAEPVDAAIIGMVQRKLQATFAEEIWDQTITNTLTQLEEERQRKLIQQATLQRVMENLIVGLEIVDNPQMIRSIQDRYEAAQAEQERLDTELAALSSQVQKIESLETLRKSIDPALHAWEHLTRDEKRTILHTFIHRVETTLVDEKGLEICIRWIDGQSDAVVLAKQMKNGWCTWLASETRQLLHMVEQRASQVEIAAAFPQRTWRMIYDKIASELGFGVVAFSPKPIRSTETYLNYCERKEKQQVTYQARGSDHWTKYDEEMIFRLYNENVPKLAYLESFPHRRWLAIIKKLKTMFGNDVLLPADKTIHRHDTLATYLERTTNKSEYTEQLEVSSDDHSSMAEPMQNCWD